MLFAAGRSVSSKSVTEVFLKRVRGHSVFTDLSRASKWRIYFSSLSLSQNKKGRNHGRVTVIASRYREIRTVLITNQIAGLDTAPSWKIVNEIC